MWRHKLILKGKEFHRFPPRNISSENWNHFSVNFKYKCPDLYNYLFKKVNFLPDSTLFLYRVWPLAFSFPFYHKRLKHHSIKGILDIQRLWERHTFDKTEMPYVIIHDQWTLNYYHWMTQALPRLLMALKLEVSLILLLPESHCTEFHIKSLVLMGIENFTSFRTGTIYYNVNNLIYPSHDIQVGDYHDDLMVELSDRLRKNLVKSSKKIFVFIHRTSITSRAIINEAEVLATFLSYGFKIVNFECLNFVEQRQIAGNASILAGIHGAGLTNMLFMEKGSKILELTTSLEGGQYYYYTLSNALGHDYYYQQCEPDDTSKSIQEANVEIDIALLRKNLELMTKPLHG